MARMTVHMLGIMYFNVCSTSNKEKRVLLPNGTESDGHIEPHYASIFVERAHCENADWWPEATIERDVSILNLRGEPVTVPVLEFRIPERSELTFPDGETGKVDVVDLEQGLPHLRKIDPYFEPDFDQGDWIAQLKVRGGTLQAFMISGGVSAVQWTTENSGPLIIRATAGKTTRTITVRPQEGRLGAEVVFSNAPDLLERVRHVRGPLRVRPARHQGHGRGHSHGAEEPHHFGLYGKIKKGGPSGRLELPSHLRNMPNGHVVIKAIASGPIENSCTGTCC